MKTLIVYFSWQGHTRKVVSALANQMKTECIEIEPVAPVRIGREAMKALISMKSSIKPIKTDMSGVDTLIIASPVWCGKVPPYVNEYLEKVENGAGKSFYVLVEMGGKGAKSAVATVRKRLEKKGMLFASSIVTIEKDVESGGFEKTINAFASAIQQESTK